jgi:hypothetical protein
MERRAGINRPSAYRKRIRRRDVILNFTMALGSTPPLMSIRNICCWVKAAGAYG